MMRLLLLRASVALGLLLSASPALAAGAAPSCHCPEQTAEEILRGASLIFTGKVAYPLPGTPKGGATFAHVITYRGVQMINPVIAPNRPGGDPACAVTFTLSQEYQVVARGSFETGYYTDKCMVDNLGQKDSRLRELVFSLGLQQSYSVNTKVPERPSSIEATRERAKLYASYNDNDLAARSYAAVARLSRNSPVDLLGQGLAMLNLGRPREALSLFDDVLEKDKDNAAAWSGRYRALAVMGRWSELPSPGAQLQDLQLRQTTVPQDLIAPDFSRTWWLSVNAEGRKLPDANFTDALLNDVNLSGADLKGAVFKGATLRDVNLSKANLSGADLTGIVYQRVTWPTGFTPPESAPGKPPERLIGEQDPAGR